MSVQEPYGELGDRSDTSGPVGAVLTLIAVLVFLGMLGWIIAKVCGGRLFRTHSKNDGRHGWMEWWLSVCLCEDIERAEREENANVSKSNDAH
ncbi:hypothetical protein SUGI_0763230 [Cryptomeria japonica]|nr:hypothetical protein SUGI_0763230 [Cryptomeria japonica]